MKLLKLIFIQVKVHNRIGKKTNYHVCVLKIQGMTIKPLVNLLNIEKKKDEQKLITEEVNDTVLDHIMSGVDVISGKRGKQYFQVRKTSLYIS